MCKTCRGGGDYSWQPVASGDSGDIILVNDEKKPRRWLILLAAVVFLVAAVGLAAWLVVRKNNKTTESEIVSDGGATNAKVDELLDSNYSEISGIQELFIDAKNGEYGAEGFFSAEVKEYMDSLPVIMERFLSELEQVDTTYITNEKAKVDMAGLISAIKSDMEIYNNTVALYDLFCDYVNNGYSDNYAQEIRNLGDDKVDAALADLDTTVQVVGDYSGSMIAEDIFGVYVGDDWAEKYYYEYMGDIIGEVRDVE